MAELRDAGVPAAAVRAYLDELGLPKHDVHFDERRLRRLAIDAIAAMPDAELAAAADAPLELVPALRGARDLVEARAFARAILEPAAAELPADAGRRWTASSSCGPARTARSTPTARRRSCAS